MPYSNSYIFDNKKWRSKCFLLFFFIKELLLAVLLINIASCALGRVVTSNCFVCHPKRIRKEYGAALNKEGVPVVATSRSSRHTLAWLAMQRISCKEDGGRVNNCILCTCGIRRQRARTGRLRILSPSSPKPHTYIGSTFLTSTTFLHCLLILHCFAARSLDKNNI